MLGEQNPYPAPESLEFIDAPEGYEFVSMSYFTRHGSRYALDEGLLPGRLQEMQELSEKGELTDAGQELMNDVIEFAQWWAANADRLGLSTDEGFQEMIDMGARAVQMVDVEPGGLMGEPIHVRTKSSGAERTLESQAAHLGGVMKQAGRSKNPVRIDNRDSLENRAIGDPQHFFGYHWGARVPLEEKAKNLIDERLQDLPDSVVAFTEELVTGLSKDEAGQFTNALFKLCQQDAPQGMRRGMCKPFEHWAVNGGNPEVIDYFFELNQIDKYYNFGPSVESKGLARQMGMPIIQDFVKVTAEAIESPETAPHLNLTFGHDAGVIGLLSALDLMETEGSNEERMATFMPYRDFPMGSNVIWQLYRQGDDYQVRMLHNERPVNFQINGCEGQEMCGWDAVQAHYSQPEYSVMPEIVPQPGAEMASNPQENLVPTF